MSQIILGLVGPIASGKGLIADHLKNLGFKTFSLSNKVREEASSRGLPIEREVLQNVGDELRLQYGNQILAERTAYDLIGENTNLVIDSIRNPGEIDYLRKFCSTILGSKIIIMGVDAPIEKRIHWYIARAKQRGEDNPDMSVFIEASLRDRGVGQASFGQQVDKCLEMSDISFCNSGTQKETLELINMFLKQQFQFDPEIHSRHKEK